MVLLLNIKGELTVVLSKIGEKYNLVNKNLNENKIKKEITQLLKKNSLRDVVNLISLRNELPKKKIYNLCLELKK